MNLTIAIAGSGSITEKNAKTLLSDFIDVKENTTLLVPNYITQEQEGLRTVIEWWGPDYVKVRKGLLVSKLDDADQCAFIVLGTEGLEDLIGQAQRAGIPVLDLCKGLFQIRMPLDGIESHADELSELPEGEGLEDESDLVTEPLRAFNPLSAFMSEQPLTRKDVEEIVMTLIQVHEQMYHNGIPVEPQPDELPQLEPPIFHSLEKEPEPNYYRSKTGKLRPMGRSKARPGEVPVYLTQEEINELS